MIVASCDFVLGFTPFGSLLLILDHPKRRLHDLEALPLSVLWWCSLAAVCRFCPSLATNLAYSGHEIVQDPVLVPLFIHFGSLLTSWDTRYLLIQLQLASARIQKRSLDQERGLLMDILLYFMVAGNTPSLVYLNANTILDEVSSSFCQCQRVSRLFTIPSMASQTRIKEDPAGIFEAGSRGSLRRTR